jgi:hypothetical protein
MNAATAQSRLPRATCHVCSAWVPVRTNGALREHRQVGSLRDNTQICSGSGQVPPPADQTEAEATLWQGSDL